MLISGSAGRSLQGMLDGFEANGIKYYNKYATLKELMGRCWSAGKTGSFILGLQDFAECYCRVRTVFATTLDRWRCGFGRPGHFFELGGLPRLAGPSYYSAGRWSLTYGQCSPNQRFRLKPTSNKHKNCLTKQLPNPNPAGCVVVAPGH